MKNPIRLLLISSLFIFAACNSISHLQIQTYSPAEVTFPESVGNMLVVNNAVPQPSDRGCTYNVFGKPDTCSIHTDSALYEACHTLGKTIVDESFFNDVLLYNKPIKTDSAGYLKDKKLTQAEVKALCDETSTQAIISLDQLLFKLERNAVILGDNTLLGQIDVQVAGVYRAYLPSREQPLATIIVGDSLRWQEYADDLKELSLILPNNDEALRETGKYIGAKSAPCFVPHWENASRWYYNGFSSRWKEASSFASMEKWDEATTRWKSLYEHAKGKDKARLASNLALCSEIKTRLTEAFDYATKSYELFKQAGGEKDTLTVMQKSYMETLAQRLQADNKLKIQYGKN